MAEPTPPLNDHAPNMPSDNDGQEHPLVFLLIPPLPATSLQRRAADVRRKRLQWTEGSPPGVYWNGDVNPLKPFVMMGYASQVTSSADTAGEPASSAVEGRIESDTEDSARSSAPSVPSSASSECSEPPDTPPDSPKEFLNKLKRRATRLRSRKTGYMLELTIPQFDDSYPDGVESSSFKLHVDTASNITWILGHDYCCAEASKSRDAANRPTQISLSNWKALPRKHHTLIPKPDGWDVISPPKDLTPPYPPYVLYHDKGVALISQLREPRPFTVKRSYNWNRSRWNVPMSFEGYQFAVAYAVDRVMAGDYTNGSLGLGLMRTQDNVPSKGAERAFSSVLADQALQLSDSSDFVDGGHILIFGMRPPWVDRLIDPSWLSINKFPGQNVTFSDRIPVSTAPTGGLFLFWSIEMLRMVFYLVDRKDSRKSRMPYGTINLEGTVFALDTGASSSIFPKKAARMIRDEIFLAEPNDDPATREKFEYTISEVERDDDFEIDFVFRGEGRNEVTVTGTTMPFMYQKSDPDYGSLIHGGDRGDYVLGLNFFQTMFVALYRPDKDNELPYVRLAPQNQSESALSVLPPREV
ncbi:hypothetical protein VTO73DRAFT_8833 [Trametes versicolor]